MGTREVTVVGMALYAMKGALVIGMQSGPPLQVGSDCMPITRGKLADTAERTRRCLPLLQVPGKLLEGLRQERGLVPLIEDRKLGLLLDARLEFGGKLGRVFRL